MLCQGKGKIMLVQCPFVQSQSHWHSMFRMSLTHSYSAQYILYLLSFTVLLICLVILYNFTQFCNKIPLCQNESLFGGFINFKPMQPRPESRRCWDKEVFLWWFLWLLVITIFNIMNILGKACLLSESRYPTPRSYFARAAHRTYNPISPSSSWTL